MKFKKSAFAFFFVACVSAVILFTVNFEGSIESLPLYSVFDSPVQAFSSVFSNWFFAGPLLGIVFLVVVLYYGDSYTEIEV